MMKKIETKENQNNLIIIWTIISFSFPVSDQIRKLLAIESTEVPIIQYLFMNIRNRGVGCIQISF
jgi:hypothetical protein